MVAYSEQHDDCPITDSHVHDDNGAHRLDIEDIEQLLEAPETDDPMDLLNTLYNMFGQSNYFSGRGQWVTYPQEDHFHR